MYRLNLQRFQLSEQCSFIGKDNNGLSSEVYSCGNINIGFYVLVFKENSEDYPEIMTKNIDQLQAVIDDAIRRFKITIRETIYYDN